MPVDYLLAAIDTILAVLVTMAFGAYAGYCRGKYKIQAPATVGHPDFERAFRIHANTIENLVLFLPTLWVASVFYGGQIPFVLGLLWPATRLVYAAGYAQSNTNLRAPGAGLGFLIIIGLIVLSVLGLLS
jgi:glutathione S-transferase